MHPQLQSIATEFRAATDRMYKLVSTVPEQLWTRRADGLPLDRVRVLSPFDARVKYNLYSCFSILPRHEHRHLWQAEQVDVHAPSTRVPR